MIDLITVVFQQELYLIEIQARSIELYIDSDKIQNIYVAVNDEDHVAAQIDTAWWGINANKVKIVPRSRWGHAYTLDGWSSQQLYKLLAANEAEAEWSMCLDAKTWFVQKLQWDKLFDSDGRVHFRSNPVNEVFKSAQIFVEQFFNISSPMTIGPAGVPFMFHTETVKDMVSYIENRTGSNFFDFFVENVKLPNCATEFILYSGFVIHKYDTHNALYTQTQHYSVTNLADWQMSKFDDIMAQMKYSQNLTASIQGRAYPHLTDTQLKTWIDFLLTKQLIADPEFTEIRLNILR